jgi:phage FluMu protein Com
MAKGPKHNADLELPDHIRPVASQPGPVVCLRCNKKFQSADKVRLRICNRCKPVNEIVFLKNEVDAKFDVWASQ